MPTQILCRDLNIEKWAWIFGALGYKKFVLEEFVFKHLKHNFRAHNITKFSPLRTYITSSLVLRRSIAYWRSGKYLLLIRTATRKHITSRYIYRAFLYNWLTHTNKCNALGTQYDNTVLNNIMTKWERIHGVLMCSKQRLLYCIS